MKIRTIFPSLLGLLVLAGPAVAVAPEDIAGKVRAFVEASNRHDVEAMIAATDPGFRWMQVVNDALSVEVAGHADLRSWLEGYFRHTPDARSTLGAVQVDGHFASVVETTTWTDGDGEPQSQSATSVYEFSPVGRIRNVWYFAAQPKAPGG